MNVLSNTEHYIVLFQGNLRICNYEFFLTMLICFSTEPVCVSALPEIDFETSSKLDDYYRCFHLLGNVMPYRYTQGFLL